MGEALSLFKEMFNQFTKSSIVSVLKDFTGNGYSRVYKWLKLEIFPLLNTQIQIR